MKPNHLLTVAISAVACLGLFSAALAQDNSDVMGADVVRAPAAASALVGVAPPSTQSEQVGAAVPVDRDKQLISEEKAIKEVRWQRTIEAVRDGENKTRQQLIKPQLQLTVDDFEEALRRIATAQNVLVSNKDVAVPEEFRDLGQKLTDLREFVVTKREEWVAWRVNNERTDALKKQEDATRRAADDRSRRIEELKTQALNARQEGQFDTAASLLDQVLVIDANDREARWLLEDAQTLSVIHKQQQQNDDRDLWTRKSLLNVREASTPYDEPMRWPAADVWKELTIRRKPMEAGTPPEPPANQRVREIMEKNVSEIRFQAISFENALNFLRDLQRVNINPNWGAMEQLGITKVTEVSLQLRDVTFETAMKELLAKVAGREDVLDYMIRDGVIKISTKEDLDKLMYILVYDVRDLLHPLLDFRAPIRQNIRGRSSDDDSGDDDDGGGLFGGDDDDDDAGSGADVAARTREEKLARFKDLVKSTVVPESWAPTGAADLKENDDGLLIIKQTANGHRELSKLLKQLREHSRIEITIEIRFVQIETRFLEDIGLDLDFIFNIHSKRHPMSAVPVNVGTFNDVRPDPISGQWGSGVSGLQNVGDVDIFQSPSGRSALAIAGSFLDDLQVDFFLRATQAHRQESHLASARITLMNGHEAFVRSGVSSDYVTIVDWDDGTPGLDEYLNGIIFGVRATVTADRRYVLMTVYPESTDDQAYASRAVDFVREINNSLGGTTLVYYSADIDLIRRDGTTVRTTVMVPDKGTLLLGGERTADEVEVETGVPVLSKVPVVKRFFTSRNFVKRERTVLILIRPEILIPEHMEPS